MLCNLVPRDKRKQVKLIVKTSGADGKRVFRKKLLPFLVEDSAAQQSSTWEEVEIHRVMRERGMVSGENPLFSGKLNRTSKEIQRRLYEEFVLGKEREDTNERSR